MKGSNPRHHLGSSLAGIILLALLLAALPGAVLASDPTVPLRDPLPTIQVAKSANPTEVAEPGGTVTFQVKVRNTSSDDLAVTLIRMEDNVYGDLLNPGNAKISNSTCASGAIQAGDTYQCTFEADVNGAGGSSVTDTVTAKVKDDVGNAAQASAQATVTITGGEPSELQVEKTANPTQVTEPGGAVTFQVKVRNSGGGQALTLVRLEDNLYGDLTSGGNSSISNSNCSLATIQVGDTYQCKFDAEVTGSDGSTATDTVTAKAKDAAGNAVQASAQASVKIVAGEKLGITVEKTANPSQVSAPGGTVTYKVKVRNSSGGASLQLVRLEDNLYGDLLNAGNSNISNSSCAQATIQPGNTYQCTFQAEVTGNSGSSVTDTVTAKAKDPAGNAVQASGQATVTIGAQPQPGIIVGKKANPTWVLEPGGTVTYKVRVTNNSPTGLPVTLSQILDNVYGDLTDLANPEITNSNCQLATIQPADTYQCSFKGQVSGNAGTTVTDMVSVTAEDNAGNQAQASAKATVKILSNPPDTGVPLTPPLIAGGLVALGAAAVAAGALVQRRAS